MPAGGRRSGNRGGAAVVGVGMMKLLRIATPATLALGLGTLPAFGQEKPWLHIQVDGDDDKTKVEVNLPLAAVEALGDSLGEKVLNEMADELEDESDVDVDAEDLRAFWQALRENPGAWVTIDEEDGGNLRARMDDNEVRIEGGDDDGSLDIRFPVSFGDALLGDEGRDPDLGAAIRALADHDDVLVSVGGDDGRVRIWIEPRSESR